MQRTLSSEKYDSHENAIMQAMLIVRYCETIPLKIVTEIKIIFDSYL